MNDLFLRACRRQAVERTPIWLMRQAGRTLPGYRGVREQVDFPTLCRTPELAARVSLEPLERLGVDAVILFSDILVPATALGRRVEFVPGPVLDPPLRSAADIERLPLPDVEQELPFVYETIRILRRELAGRAPVVGFAAAPFTLAAYLVEGRGSRGFEETRRLLYGDPAAAHCLLDKLTRLTADHLAAQARAGAQALQLFDTWTGLLAPAEYREFGLPYVRRVLEHLAGAGVPLIYFALDAGHLLGAMRDCGADVVSLDWRVDLASASAQLGHRFVLQGNLDPAVLLASPAVIERRATAILELARGLPGHVFNLGHGVLPTTPLENLETLVRVVRAHRAT